MIIEVNKDIDKYQESVVLGLTARQLIYSVASVLVGGGMVLLLYRYIGLTGAAYVTIPCVAPIAMGGFYSYNGMNFYEYMGRRIHFMFGNRPLTYVSTESEAEGKKLFNVEANVEKKGLFGFNFLSSKKKGVGVGSSEIGDVSGAIDGSEELQDGETDSTKTKAIQEQHKREEFEAVKRKMKLTIITVIFFILAAVAALIVKRFVI